MHIQMFTVYSLYNEKKIHNKMGYFLSVLMTQVKPLITPLNHIHHRKVVVH